MDCAMIWVNRQCVFTGFFEAVVTWPGIGLTCVILVVDLQPYLLEQPLRGSLR